MRVRSSAALWCTSVLPYAADTSQHCHRNAILLPTVVWAGFKSCCLELVQQLYTPVLANMRRNASLRPNKQVFLAIWVALGFTVLVLASIAWKRSSAAVIKVSTILHTLGPESPAGPSSLVDLHAEIGFLKQERFQARQQRDTAQTQAQQLQDQLNAVNKQLEDSLSSQQNSTTSLENVSGDRHVPWAPSLSRDQQSSNPELAAILRYSWAVQ